MGVGFLSVYIYLSVVALFPMIILPVLLCGQYNAQLARLPMTIASDGLKQKAMSV